MTVTIRCFTKIADAEPSRVLTGDSYQALIERPSPSQAKDGSEYARVILNPNHDDPKKSAQIHVRAGERNSTDPLRFERVEVWGHDQTGESPEEPRLTWYGDIDGNTKRPEPSMIEEVDQMSQTLGNMVSQTQDSNALQVQESGQETHDAS